MWHIRTCIAKSDPLDFEVFYKRKCERHDQVVKNTLRTYNKIYFEIFGRERVKNVTFSVAAADEDRTNNLYNNNDPNMSSMMHNVQGNDLVANNDSNDNLSNNDNIDKIDNNISNIDDTNGSNNIDENNNDISDNDDKNGTSSPNTPKNVYLYIITKGILHYKVGYTTVEKKHFISRYHSHVGEFNFLKYDVVHENMAKALDIAQAIELEFKHINMRHRTYSNLEFFHKKDENKKDMLPTYRKCLVSLIRKHLQIEVRCPYSIP